MSTTWTDVTRVPAGTIIVGWDGSRHSRWALAWAVDRARGERRPITVVHVMSPHVAGDLAAWVTEDELLRVERGALAEARTYLDEHARDLEVGVLVVAGDARTVLTDLSRHAAIVVVGSHGRGPVASKALGSVSVAVVRNAACPVVVVRSYEPGVVRRGVLAAVGFDERAAAVAEFAFHEASVLRLPVTVVHRIPADSSWVIEANAQRQLSEILAGSGEKFPDVRSAHLVVKGETQDVIVEESRDRHLTVIGSPTVRRRVLPTTTARLIERTQSPIAVVPLDPVAEDPSAAQAGRRSDVGGRP